MNEQARRRAAALFEVLGVYLTGAFLNDKIVNFLANRHWISTISPFSLLTPHASNGDLLLASRQLLLADALIYGSFFLLIIPLDLWNGENERKALGLTRAGLSWRVLILAGIVTAVLTQWPVLLHTVVDAIHPLGAMAPWRQAFFDMSWRRWQFWLFAGILSYAVVPVVEELVFRGYYQRRLAKDWGDGPAIIGTACLFTFAHRQYLIANLYNVTMIISLLCLAIGLGVVFAWTRSLFPSMIAHAIINVPVTTFGQGVMLVIFVIGAFFTWRHGRAVAKKVFANARVMAFLILTGLMIFYAIAAGRFHGLTPIAIGLLIVAVALEGIDHARSSHQVGIK